MFTAIFITCLGLFTASEPGYHHAFEHSMEEKTTLKGNLSGSKSSAYNKELFHKKYTKKKRWQH